MHRRAVLASLLLLACAASPRRASGPGALPAGCPVEILRDPHAGGGAVGLGSVTARCTGDAMTDVAWCTRALQDQACALGATVLWGISQSQTDDALVMRGFAGRRP